MRRLSLIVAVVVGVTSGAYTIVYLYRWEWNRAAIAGLFFLATEIIFVTSLVLRRLWHIEHRLNELSAPPRQMSSPALEAALRDTRADPHAHFAWLRDSATSTNVFLPVLLGLGVVTSVLGWVVEHIARATTSPVLERRLAERLVPITVPAEGLLVAPPPPATGGRRRVGRWLALAVVIVVTAAGSAATIDFLADEIQTRPDALRDDVETVLDLQLRGQSARRDPERTFNHLWAVCTAPGIFSDRYVEPVSVRHADGGAVQVVVAENIGEHGLARLTGCLRDTTLDRVQASVVSVRTIDR